MMMTIGSVELDNDLIWTDEFNFTNGVGSAANTIYGNLVVQTFTIKGYRPLTLAGDSTHGWQMRDTVLALQVLANTAPEEIHVVTLSDGRVFNAMFRNEESPVLEFSPITQATAPGSNFWYYGTIKMRIVE